MLENLFGYNLFSDFSIHGQGGICFSNFLFNSYALSSLDLIAELLDICTGQLWLGVYYVNSTVYDFCDKIIIIIYSAVT